MSSLQTAATALAAHGVTRIGKLEKLLSIRDLEDILGVERTTLFRWYKAGKFPSPSHLMGRRVWPLSVVESWVAAQLEQTGPVPSNLSQASQGASSAA